MTLVKCLECGSAQDYDTAVGYCEQCGRKLPVPLKRGKDSVRQQLRHGTGGNEVGVVNVTVTVVLGLALLAAVIAVAVLIIRSQL
ncbi:MAG TPA: hypothetical protein VKE40_03170 [Gemmataceae bacterium]|nr:hypothetical protein [Gemmataceae bacterium]